MAKIYIDAEFKCHTTNPDGTFREIVLSENARAFFAGKCKTFIEGYRYCPEDESYVRDDGEVFYGEQITPWKDLEELDAAQREYEQQLIAEYESSSILTADLQKAYDEGVASA